MLEFKKDWLIIDRIDVTDINLAIDKIIKDYDVELMEGVSTHGKNSKQYKLNQYLKNHRILKIVKDKIKNLLHNKFNHSPNLNLVSAWTVKGQEHGFHVLHKHDYSIRSHIYEDKTMHIASVTYLSMPEPIQESLSRETNNFYCVLNRNGETGYYTYKPVVGDIIVFPIWLWHGAYPQSKGLRQTLNIDFEVNF